MASTGTRRGRLPAAERATRRAAVLDAALAELVEHGWPGVTMLGVARRAQASKETLYAWFGSREGLMEALVERNADQTAHHLRQALDHDADPVDVLVQYAQGLLSLLVSAGSVALNRAAAGSPDLAAVLLRAGRHRVGPVVEQYLARLHARGVLDAPDAAAAFRLLYGLTVQDTQIRVLLGEPPPPPDVIAARSREAVTRFLLLSPGPQTGASTGMPSSRAASASSVS